MRKRQLYAGRRRAPGEFGRYRDGDPSTLLYASLPRKYSPTYLLVVN
jgi:hypothetical protein